MNPPFRPGDRVRVASSRKSLVVRRVVPSDFGAGWQIAAESEDQIFYTIGPSEHFVSEVSHS